MAYRANVTDKQQSDVENALDDSAIRIPWFSTGTSGVTKFIRAYDAVPQTGVAVSQSDVVKRAGKVISSHNDKPWRELTPGKA